ncbi:DUF1656 domain-containing protein [Klebsiella michiganensis]|uniref:DUF1656 domain-containing protein n=1 Tax=Klebsiella michiganensis TaxID=1134687 RepID=UPI0018D458F4|nr:DUF1656 domain-containing protein [Klebsiella michiganensis]
MTDLVLFGMSFPYIFKVMVQGYLLYVAAMALVKHTKLWHKVWHKPMVSFSIYMLSLSVNYWF